MEVVKYQGMRHQTQNNFPPQCSNYFRITNAVNYFHETMQYCQECAQWCIVTKLLSHCPSTKMSFKMLLFTFTVLTIHYCIECGLSVETPKYGLIFQNLFLEKRFQMWQQKKKTFTTTVVFQFWF